MARIIKPPACTECGWSITGVRCKRDIASQREHWPKATRHCTGFKGQPLLMDAILILRNTHPSLRPPSGVKAYVVSYDIKTNTVKTCKPLQHVLRHSPDGFEFGYSGSGPADLALSIATELFGAEEAEELYQGLKDKFLANIPIERKKVVIHHRDIVEWYAQQKRK